MGNCKKVERNSLLWGTAVSAEAEGQFEVEGGDLSGPTLSGMDGNAWLFISTLIYGSVLG